MWNTAKWRTAIPTNSRGAAGGDVDVVGDVADAGIGRSFAVVGVLGLAVGLAVLPTLLALGVGTVAMGRLAVLGPSLVAVLGGVQLAAVTLGVLHFVRRPRGQVYAASND